jgi:hypothetical protein
MKIGFRNVTLFLATAATLGLSCGCVSNLPLSANPNQVSGGSGSSSDSGSSNSGSGGSNSGSGSSGGSSSGGSGSGSGGSGSGSGGSGSGSTGSGGSTTTPSVVPADAVIVTDVQALDNWKGSYDTGTSGGTGSATGTMSLVATPSMSGQAREFTTTYTDAGGERYSVSFASDTASHNFFYDAWVYLPQAPTDIANLELDMNQVIADGQTVIFGFQCDGYHGTWDYSGNTGTPAEPVVHWKQSTATCNVQNWSIQVWHHVQVSYSRDDSGNVTYNSVWLDDVEQPINATVPSAFALGWGPVLVTNFQVDGRGASGSSTIYLDDLTVYRW